VTTLVTNDDEAQRCNKPLQLSLQKITQCLRHTVLACTHCQTVHLDIQMYQTYHSC